MTSRRFSFASALLLACLLEAKPARATTDWNCGNNQHGAWFEMGRDIEIVSVFGVTVRGQDWARYPTNPPESLPLRIERHSGPWLNANYDFFDKATGELVMELNMRADGMNDRVGHHGVLTIKGEGTWAVECTGL